MAAKTHNQGRAADSIDYTKSTKDGRYRNWAFILYPESAPEDWAAILHGLHVKGFVSPLHDLDVNPTGERKKAHHHVMLLFDGKKSYKQVKAIADSLKAARPEPVQDVRAYARYLCHMDNPEKAQYELADVMEIGGADYLEKVGSASDVDQIVRDIQRWIVENECIFYADLADYAAEYRPDWLRVISGKRTMHFKAYLKSHQYRLSYGEKK